MASDNEGEPRRQLGGELVIPIAAVALTIYYFSTILDSPWTAQATAAVVGVILLVCCGIFFVHAGIDLAAGRASLGLRSLIEPLDSLWRKSGLLALTVAALVVMPWIGFTATAIVFLSAAILLLREGRQAARVIAFAVTLSLLWFLVFVAIFKRQFPLGWLDVQLKAIVAPLLKSMGLD